MLGAIIGDIVGSRFEFHPIKSKRFDLFFGDGFKNYDKMTIEDFNTKCRFTDDTVMTLAVCEALMDCDGDYTYLSELAIYHMQDLGKRYPLAGYGGKFNQWLRSENPLPYNSFGNGSAMRISAVPYFAKDIEQLKELTYKVTAVTHNHPEGLKGAEAIAICIWFARQGKSKEFIKEYIEKNYYKLDFNYDEFVRAYKFDETCQGSVPQSIFAFLISDSYEDTIRTAISMGGDADTMACISGAIAEAYYGLPKEIEKEMYRFLSPELKEIVEDFKHFVG